MWKCRYVSLKGKKKQGGKKLERHLLVSNILEWHSGRSGLERSRMMLRGIDPRQVPSDSVYVRIITDLWRGSIAQSVY